jgi:hypothetical protein
LCAGGGSAGHARCVRHQPPAGLDPAAVVADAGRTLWFCIGARPRCICGHHALRW